MGKKISKGAKKQILSFLFLFVLVGITLVILFLSNRELDFRSIGDFLRRSNPLCLILAFCCMLAYILFEAISLHLAAHTMGHKCKFRSSVVYSTSDIYYSAITPSAAGGQPASAYYMVQDGMSTGAASFTLVFNLIAYTGAIIILGGAAFILRPGMFVQFGFLVKLLIILGVVAQCLLLTFFILCMFWHGAVRKCGYGIIAFLHKIKIIKKADKWRGKLDGAIAKYAGCLGTLGKHRVLFVFVLLLNIAQRAAQMLVPCFVCAAVAPDVSFLDILVMQAYVTLGYNSIPLPGGVGAFEYLYLHIYGLRFDAAFILAAMMVTRTISYYISMALSGAVTLAYHGYLIRKKGRDAMLQAEAEAIEGVTGDPPDDASPEQAEESEPREPAEQTEEENEADTLGQPDAQPKDGDL